MIAGVAQEQIEKFTNRRIILDDENCDVGLGGVEAGLLPGRLGGRGRRCERHGDAEHRTAPRTRSQIDGMAEKTGQSLHDGESEAEPLAALAGGLSI